MLVLKRDGWFILLGGGMHKVLVKNNGGFTLIELIIIIVIVGILAAVAIPQYQNYVTNAKISKVATAVDPVKMGIAQFYQTNGAWPAAMASGGDWTSVGIGSG